jgi:acyl-CoA thioester hydrolase
MGFVYYGVYAQYFEVGRVESLRSLGIRYKDLEEGGIMLPVRKLEVNYKAPARYDDLISVQTEILQMPSTRISFDHKVFNENNDLLCTGRVELVFVDSLSKRPRKVPPEILEVLQPFFKNETSEW